MSEDRPPAGLLISAQIRIAAREGVPMMIRKKGDDMHGAILLKVNRLDNTAHVLSQVRIGEEVGWNPVSKIDPMPESEAEKYLARQMQIDPDIWIVEIEDRHGRHWFPGKIAKPPSSL